MIAYLEPAQFLGTLVMGIGLGMMLTRGYDAVRHKLAMRRIGRNVKAYAAAWPFPPFPTKTSGPEAAPANRDPQEPVPGQSSGPDAGVAVQSAATGEGAPPARSFNKAPKVPWDGEWHTDWTDGR